MAFSGAVNCAIAQDLEHSEMAPEKAASKAPGLEHLQIIQNPPSLDKKNPEIKFDFKKDLQRLKLRLDGGVDSGGGTLVQMPNRLGVLDLYLHNPAAFYSEKKRTAPLLETRAYKKYGIDTLSADSGILAKTLLQIQHWESTSPLLAKSLKAALKNLPIFYINGSFQFISASYVVPESLNIPEEQLKLGALYIKDFGVLISKTDFDLLSEKNQMALLIHEALRHQQISFGQKGLSHDRIQRITAQLVNTPNTSLDTEEYLTGDQLRIYQNKHRIIQNIRDAAESICPQVPEACPLVGIEDEDELSTLSSLMSRIVSQVEKIVNNSSDSEVASIYYRSHSILLDAWKPLIHLHMDLTNQSYKEVLFDFSGTQRLIYYLKKYNREEAVSVEIAQAYFEAIRAFQKAGLIK